MYACAGWLDAPTRRRRAERGRWSLQVRSWHIPRLILRPLDSQAQRCQAATPTTAYSSARPSSPSNWAAWPIIFAARASSSFISGAITANSSRRLEILASLLPQVLFRVHNQPLQFRKIARRERGILEQLGHQRHRTADPFDQQVQQGPTDLLRRHRGRILRRA